MNDQPGKILLVEDDGDNAHAVAWVFSEILPGWGLDVTEASGIVEALEQARRGPFDALLTDIRMQETGGPLFLRTFRRLQPDTPTIVINPLGTADAAQDAMNAGASAYITRPFSVEDVRRTLDRAMERRPAVERPRPAGGHSGHPVDLVGRSRATAGLDWAIAQAAVSRSPVLIQGERGAGKGLVARAIHHYGDRATGPFVELRCADLPDDVLERELFGSAGRGDGASRTGRPGAVESASGGTLVLDEVADLSFSLQERLLQVFNKLGMGWPGGGDRPSDARLLSTSRVDIASLVRLERFQAGLHQRLAGVTIALPTLRERKEDIPPLVDHFLRKLNTLSNKAVEGVSPEVLERFRQYDWPGNVRELRDILERAVIVAATPTIRMADLPVTMREGTGTIPARELALRRDS